MRTDSPTIASCPACGTLVLWASETLIHPLPEDREAVSRALGAEEFRRVRLRLDGRFHRCPAPSRRGRRQSASGAEDGGVWAALLFTGVVLSTASASALESKAIPALARSGAEALGDDGPFRPRTAVSDAPWAGRALSSGRYQIIDRLAEGALGSVFLALDHRLGTEVAVWMPRASEAGQLSRLRALARWNHPHLVHVLDLGAEDGLPFAVTEAPAGGSLLFRRFAGPEDRPRRDVPAELAGWLPQVAEALDFLHARGVAHGDVRPGNVLFDAHGRVYLAAFGVGTLSQGKDGEGKALDPTDDQHALALMVSESLSDHRAVPELAEAVRRGRSADPLRRYRDCSTFARVVLSAARATNPTAHRADAIARTPPTLALPARRGAALALGKRGVLPRLLHYAPWAVAIALALGLARRRPRPLRSGRVMKQIAEKPLQPRGREIVRVENRRREIAPVSRSPTTAPTSSVRVAVTSSAPVVPASVSASATPVRLSGWGERQQTDGNRRHDRAE